LVGSAIISFVISTYFGISFYLEGKAVELMHWVISFVFSFIVSVWVFVADGFIIGKIQKYYPWEKSNAKRIILEITLTNIGAVSGILILSEIVALFFTMSADEPRAKTIYDQVVIVIIINLIVTGWFEANYLLQRWKISIFQSEKLKRQQAEMKYAALTSQVNPHFLFNSLNTLASIIPKSTEMSLKFIGRFSEIYRYVLDSKDKYLVEVEEENRFIQAYIFLQKSRFGESINFEINLDSTVLKQLIPPLSIQLLVENAIKHNEISAEKPLRINITSSNDFLIVTNNYQSRPSDEESAGIGLNNLKARYELLTDEKPVFQVENQEYVAKIPLIKELG
jgi:sensor histidine kinase YesM